MNIKELYYECLLYEEKFLAHYIHYFLQEGILQLEDDITKLDLEKADHKTVSELIMQNVLCIYKIRIYSLKMNQNEFVFIFAKSREEAVQFYHDLFKRKPLNCHEYPLDFELEKGMGVVTFREMRKEYDKFPVIAGYYERR